MSQMMLLGALRCPVPTEGLSPASVLMVEQLMARARLAADEIEQLTYRVRELEALIEEFCARGERGEVRSEKTYAAFRAALFRAALGGQG